MDLPGMDFHLRCTTNGSPGGGRGARARGQQRFTLVSALFTLTSNKVGQQRIPLQTGFPTWLQHSAAKGRPVLVGC